MRCIVCGIRMTVEREFSEDVDGKEKRYALWKCSNCGHHDVKKLSWRQIKYRDDEDYRNYTKNKMREIYYKRKHEELQTP